MFTDHLLKAKKEYKNLKQQEIHDIFIKTNWKAFFFYEELLMKSYVEFKDLPRRTASDKVLQDKAFNIAKNAK